MFQGFVAEIVDAHQYNYQGSNEICGIRDQKGGIWDHSIGIRDHKPKGQDQRFFQGSGTRLYHPCWIGDHN